MPLTDNGGGYDRLQQTQAAVDEVTGIMRDNIEKVSERGGNLGELDERAAALEGGSRQFERSSHKLQRRMYWKDKRTTAILVCVAVVIVGALILVVYLIVN